MKTMMSANRFLIVNDDRRRRTRDLTAMLASLPGDFGSYGPTIPFAAKLEQN